MIIKPNCAYNGIALENTAHDKIYAIARLANETRRGGKASIGNEKKNRREQRPSAHGLLDASTTTDDVKRTDRSIPGPNPALLYVYT